MSAASAAESLSSTSQWRSGTDLLEASADSLTQATQWRPRMAKAEDQARAVQNAWRAEIEERQRTWKRTITSISSELRYQDEDGTALYGHVFRPSASAGAAGQENGAPSLSGNSLDDKLPAILFFQTGAGPHDLFLHWKAASLATDVETFPDGCVVFISDITSDDRGWGWDNDKTRYNNHKKELLTLNNEAQPTLLRRRIRAAVETTRRIPGVDTSRMAALGWCVGGCCIMELARMRYDSVNAMATFHGLFPSLPKMLEVLDQKVDQGEDEAANESRSNDAAQEPTHTSLLSRKREVLLFHGVLDPYVKLQDIHLAQEMFKRIGVTANLITIADAKHSFSTPASVHHPNQVNFAYSEAGSRMAWSSTRTMLKRSVSSQK